VEEEKVNLTGYRNRKYLDWLKEQPCAVCMRKPCDPAHQSLGWPSGTGIKPPDSFCLPLNHDLHMKQHRVGEVRFWQEFFGLPAGTEKVLIHGMVARLCLRYFTEFLESQK
jgi:hypothetical protein